MRGERPSFVALEGHQGPVVSASFSPDGTHVVTASDDNTARVWDLRGERPTFVALEGHQESGQLRVVQRRRDACGHGLQRQHGAGVGSARRAADLRRPRRASGVRSTPRRSAPTERMWSRRPTTRRRGFGICAASGRPSSPSRGIRSPSTPRRSAPTELMWSRPPTTTRRGCGICAASGRPSSPSKDIKVGSLPRRSAPTGRMSSQRRWTARRGFGIWARSGQASSPSRGIRIRISSASFSPDGTHVVTASADKTARVWDLRGNAADLRRARGASRSGLSPRRSALMERVWSRRRMTALHGCGICAASGRLPSPSRGIRVRSVKAAFSPDGTHVVTASADKTAQVWRLLSDVNELIRLARANLLRCLSQAQRDAYGLRTEHPSDDRNFVPPPTPDGRCPG